MSIDSAGGGVNGLPPTRGDQRGETPGRLSEAERVRSPLGGHRAVGTLDLPTVNP